MNLHTYQPRHTYAHTYIYTKTYTNTYVYIYTYMSFIQSLICGIVLGFTKGKSLLFVTECQRTTTLEELIIRQTHSIVEPSISMYLTD